MPPFARFFTQGLAERLRNQPAFSAETAFGGNVLLPVGSLVERPPVTVPAEATVLEAARVMRDEGVSSVLLLTDPPAIVTDRDLRNRVLAAGLGPATPARDVASSPIRTLPYGTPVYGAWQAMLEHGIHHLPLERDGRIVGVVTSTDLMRHQSHGPILTFKRVERMRSRDALRTYGTDLAQMVATLVRSGLPATHIARLVSHLNDALVRRLLVWAERDLGEPPCPYAFLVFGSEGRFEQTLLTDQDNALVYRDGDEPTRSYFRRLAHKVVADLVAAGFPPCPGGYMATNHAGSLSEWIDRFGSWIDTPKAEAVLAAGIFFDHRSAGGGLDLSPLTDVLERARRNAPFLSHLARGAVAFRPPLGAFRRLELENGGVDLKKGGIAPIQGLARVWALDAGVPRHTHRRPAPRRDGRRAPRSRVRRGAGGSVRLPPRPAAARADPGPLRGARSRQPRGRRRPLPLRAASPQGGLPRRPKRAEGRDLALPGHDRVRLGDLLPARSPRFTEVVFWALDLETEGLDPRHDAILSVGMVPVRRGVVRLGEAFSSLVRPREERAPSIGALGAHHLRPLDTRDAPDLEDVLPEIARRLDGNVLLVHHAPIDVRFLAGRLQVRRAAAGPRLRSSTPSASSTAGPTRSAFSETLRGIPS